MSEMSYSLANNTKWCVVECIVALWQFIFEDNVEANDIFHNFNGRDLKQNLKSFYVKCGLVLWNMIINMMQTFTTTCQGFTSQQHWILYKGAYYTLKIYSNQNYRFIQVTLYFYVFVCKLHLTSNNVKF